MKPSKKKCAFCPVWFNAHPRLSCRQKTCGSAECKRQQKRLSQKNWQTTHPTDYQTAQQDWRNKNPDYWQNWRNTHPAYAKRNRTQTKIRKKLRKGGLQKRIDILQVIEKQMKPWNLPRFAKQNRSLTPLLWAYNPSHENIHSP